MKLDFLLDSEYFYKSFTFSSVFFDTHLHIKNARFIIDLFQLMLHPRKQLVSHDKVICLAANFPGLNHFHWLNTKGSVILIGWVACGHVIESDLL